MEALDLPPIFVPLEGSLVVYQPEPEPRSEPTSTAVSGSNPGKSLKVPITILVRTEQVPSKAPAQFFLHHLSHSCMRSPNASTNPSRSNLA